MNRSITWRDILIGVIFLTLSAQSAPLGNGGPNSGGGTVTSVTAGDSSITIGGTAAAPTVALSASQPNANTWASTQTYTGAQAAQNFISQVYNAAGACGGLSNAPTADMCSVGTEANALAIGPQVASWAGDGAAHGSGQISLSSINASNVLTTMTMSFSTSHTLTFGNIGSLSTSSNPITIGTAALTQGAILQGGTACSGSSPVTGTTGMTACTVTCASSTWSFAYGHTFTSTPVVIFSDESGGSTATLTTHSTTTAAGACTTGHLIDVQVTGNPT